MKVGTVCGHVAFEFKVDRFRGVKVLTTRGILVYIAFFFNIVVWILFKKLRSYCEVTIL